VLAFVVTEFETFATLVLSTTTVEPPGMYPHSPPQGSADAAPAKSPNANTIATRVRLIFFSVLTIVLY
jgi:hypothetical protein